MTIENLKRPALWGLGILAFAGTIEFLVPYVSVWFGLRPDALSTVLRLFNGYVLIVLIGRDIMGRNKQDIETRAQRRVMESKLDDIRFLVEEYEKNRSDSLSETKIAADVLAEQLKLAVGVRQSDVDTALRAQTTTLVAKIEEGTEASRAAQQEANNINAKIASLGQQIKVGSDHAEHAFTEANDVNRKIENLNKALVKQGEQTAVVQQQSDERLESIETTGEASHTILKENLVQADQRAVDVAADVASAAASVAADVANTAAKVASKAAGIAAGQLDKIEATGESTNEIVKGAGAITKDVTR